MYNKPQGITLFSVVIIEKNWGIVQPTHLLFIATMKYNKQPLDIPTQIAMLKGRGLNIADEQAAEKTLSRISYFRLAAYLRPMEADKNTHQYKPMPRLKMP